MRERGPCPEPPQLTAPIGPVEVHTVRLRNCSGTVGSVEVLLEKPVSDSQLCGLAEGVPVGGQGGINGFFCPQPPCRVEAEREVASVVHEPLPDPLRYHL